MTIETTAVPAGWYADPAGSPALRWWDGTQWTAHLHQAAPTPLTPAATQAQAQTQAQSQAQALAPVHVAPLQPVATEPQINLSAYRPGVGYGGAPGIGTDYQRGSAYGSPRGGPASGPVSNRVAYFSFIAGILAISVILIRLELPNGNYFLPFFGLSAIVSGLRSIVRYRRGRVSALWAGIIGLVLGVIAEALLIAFVLLPTVAAAGANGTPPTSGNIGPTGAITTYDAGSGRPQYLPQSNGTLEQAATDENKLVGMLQSTYAPTKVGPTADGSWPAHLIITSAGDVRSPDGHDFGQVVEPGFHLAYQLEPDGSYLMGISGPDTDEVAVYTSQSDHYVFSCESSDQTCTTNSPIAPFTSAPSGTSTSAPSTT